MKAAASSAGRAVVDASAAPVTDVLDQVAMPVSSARVALASGRTYELESGEAADSLVIRSSGGEVVLRVEVGEAGPVLSFSAAELRLSSVGRLALEGAEVAVRSRGSIEIDAGASLIERVGGDHHTTVAGDERLEATNVELLAGTGHMELVAEGHVRLDGEHIGLNDAEVPVPFPWSRRAADDDG